MPEQRFHGLCHRFAAVLKVWERACLEARAFFLLAPCVHDYRSLFIRACWTVSLPLGFLLCRRSGRESPWQRVLCRTLLLTVLVTVPHQHPSAAAHGSLWCFAAATYVSFYQAGLAAALALVQLASDG